MKTHFTLYQVSYLLKGEKPSTQSQETQFLKSSRGPGRFNSRAYLLQQKDEAWILPILDPHKEHCETVIFSREFDLSPFVLAFLDSLFHYQNAGHFKVVVWDPNRTLEALIASPVPTLRALLKQLQTTTAFLPEEISQAITRDGKQARDAFTAIDLRKVEARYRDMPWSQKFKFPEPYKRDLWDEIYQLEIKEKGDYPLPPAALAPFYRQVNISSKEEFAHLQHLMAAKILPRVNHLSFTDPTLNELAQAKFAMITLHFNERVAPTELVVSEQCEELTLQLKVAGRDEWLRELRVRGGRNLKKITVVNNTSAALSLDLLEAANLAELHLTGENIFLKGLLPIRILSLTKANRLAGLFAHTPVLEELHLKDQLVYETEEKVDLLKVAREYRSTSDKTTLLRLLANSPSQWGSLSLLPEMSFGFPPIKQGITLRNLPASLRVLSIAASSENHPLTVLDLRNLSLLKNLYLRNLTKLISILTENPTLDDLLVEDYPFALEGVISQLAPSEGTCTLVRTKYEMSSASHYLVDPTISLF